jgi:murein DD-endopeptidase MepM/ murein hydrolase activator NlpD
MHRDGATRNALVLVGNGRALVRTTRPRPVHEIYLSETGGRLALRLKWALSTLIAGIAGLCIIGVAIYAANNGDSDKGFIPSITEAINEAMKPRRATRPTKETPFGAGGKSDRIRISSKGSTTSQIIQDTVVEHRGSREFITVKPYIRILASLGTAKPDDASRVPPFNPFDLYAAESPAPGVPKSVNAAKQDAAVNQHVEIRYSPLIGDIEEDGQKLGSDEAERLVAEADAVYAETMGSIKQSQGGEGEQKQANNKSATSSAASQTTVVQKKNEAEVEEEDIEMRQVIAEQGDTVLSLIMAAGGEKWQARAIADLMATTPMGRKLKPGQELRFTLALAAANPSQRDPIKVSLFTGLRHEATVSRSPAGEYFLGGTPVNIMSAGAKEKEEGKPQRATLYSSIYQAALAGRLPASAVLKLLRVHVYDIDYKTKTHPGDAFDLFFDTKENSNGESPEELLFTSLSIGGESHRYYRFRSSDGSVDYYNETGSSSKKFLMHMPVRGGRFTSGFGYRRHPILGIYKMHTGVDWAAPKGTPIVAAGNGMIEIAEREGGYGNYIRIKHGNGYETAYGHLSRYAAGIKKGVKVRQGQIIGYVGTTGRSSGPHLHYEVLINNRQVNPLGISVPRGRQLAGRALADFKKEKSRIDNLMARTPVKTRMAAIQD